MKCPSSSARGALTALTLHFRKVVAPSKTRYIIYKTKVSTNVTLLTARFFLVRKPSFA